MFEIKCIKCDSVYKVKEEYAGKQVRCKKCGHLILIVEPVKDDVMPDFDSLFTALAEEERRAPTLADSMVG